jgi:FlaA1/EpsC-like NDP-sugar epimerase
VEVFPVKMVIRKISKLLKERFLLKYRTALIVSLNIFLVLCSFLIAWALRFEFYLPPFSLLLFAVPVLIVMRLAANARFNLLHGWWRYAGLNEAVDVAKSTVVGSLGFFVSVHYILSSNQIPVSVYVGEAIITAGLLSSVRVFSRLSAEAARVDLTGCKRVAIIGAGFAAQMIIRELKRPRSNYVAVACFDDDRSKVGIRLHGVPVLGTVDQIAQHSVGRRIDEVLIAVPSATGMQMRRFVQSCEQAGLPFKTVPSLRDLISGQAQINQLREVDVEDLLGREPVSLDLKAVRKHISGKVVMVTGAAGSIGSELSRQILDYGPAKLICVDQNETGIFYLERELSSRRAGTVICCVAHIGDAERMRKVCSVHGVKMIFHAAAYKHVPVMEENVQEAVNNNVFSLLNFLAVSEETGCETFLMISSDKAVNPTNVMGCTKRVGELVLSAWPRKQMRCVSVRFGNVLGSSGSVIPVFREQLRRRQPITITHPEIQRFFMTIPEAVALVLQASVIGEHKDILVLDMGEPVRIVDLAHTLIRLSGKQCDDVEIRFTGLRNGEKLVEELFYATEKVQNTTCAQIKRTVTESISWTELYGDLERLKSSLYVDGADPILRVLKRLVPESSFNRFKTEAPSRFAKSLATPREDKRESSAGDEKDLAIVTPAVPSIGLPSEKYRTNSA